MIRGRRAAAIAFAVVLVAVLWPIAGGRDGFPFSNYPMFSGDRPREVTVHHVIGRNAAGRGRPLPPRALGTEEVMQASQTARFAARNAERAADLCRRVAANVQGLGSAWADVVEVELRVDVFDAVEYWETQRIPRRGETIARCPVVGRP